MPASQYLPPHIESPGPHAGDSADALRVLNRQLSNQLVEANATIAQLQERLAAAAAAAHGTGVSATPPRSPASFARFGSLPAEIRQMVWRWALPRRVLKIEGTMSVPDCGRCRALDHRLPAPAVAGSCREARAVALEHGGIHAGALRQRWHGTWFDTSTDTVLVDGALSFIPDVPRFSRRVESVAVRQALVEQDPRRVFDYLLDAQQWPRLRTVLVVLAQTFLVHRPRDWSSSPSCLAASPAANEQLLLLDDPLAGCRFVLVEAHHRERLHRMVAYTAQAQSAATKLDLLDLRIGEKLWLRSVVSQRRYSVSAEIQLVADFWHDRIGWDEVKKLAWVQESLETMPNIVPVVLFERCKQ